MSQIAQVPWLSADVPSTIGALVKHTRCILVTDLSYSIIVSAEGCILDGVHRLDKVWINGSATVDAVRFAAALAPGVRVLL